MAKTGRLELRVEAELLARVDARCGVLGQTRTKFIERALESALKFEDRLPEPRVKVWPDPVETVVRRESDPPVPGFKPPALAKPMPGVRPAREFVLDPRQARLNKAKGS